MGGVGPARWFVLEAMEQFLRWRDQTIAKGSTAHFKETGPRYKLGAKVLSAQSVGQRRGARSLSEVVYSARREHTPQVDKSWWRWAPDLVRWLCGERHRVQLDQQAASYSGDGDCRTNRRYVLGCGDADAGPMLAHKG